MRGRRRLGLAETLLACRPATLGTLGALAGLCRREGRPRWGKGRLSGLPGPAARLNLWLYPRRRRRASHTGVHRGLGRASGLGAASTVRLLLASLGRLLRR